MKSLTQLARVCVRIGLIMLFGTFLPGWISNQVRGEDPFAPLQPEANRHFIPQEPASTPPATPSTRIPGRIRLFRIQPGFLSETRWLDQEDALPPELRAPESDPDDWIAVNVGNDNPNFELRHRNDPGGVGFTRINTQMELLDTGRTAFSLGLQAVTPAGLEFDGLPDRMGPTVVTPALSIFHSVDDDLAVQAFVGKHMPLMNRAVAPISRDLQYGVAVQRPLVPGSSDFLRHVYLSVGALGLHRMEREVRSGVAWELLPGLHYKVADNWWISGAVSVPVGPTRVDASQLWQVTCSLQF